MKKASAFIVFRSTADSGLNHYLFVGYEWSPVPHSVWMIFDRGKNSVLMTQDCRFEPNRSNKEAPEIFTERDVMIAIALKGASMHMGCPKSAWLEIENPDTEIAVFHASTTTLSEKSQLYLAIEKFGTYYKLPHYMAKMLECLEPHLNLVITDL
ncbi:hypothetical protein JIN85_04740 [Luteolibacter pohnpeiensis]|uniref:Uncharacterized protein n=1 Tax=Luteolibacter pohnpeiensis TaxID=454153 RepID=A0A934VVE3_9BACT|nr:hypothetical protein [Luteolibacter pohnpeiensis]MBK1881708.1 hypothetical protein [Luteolibacter pohnpeiensis]